jgi:hypothetical protein
LPSPVFSWVSVIEGASVCAGASLLWYTPARPVTIEAGVQGEAEGRRRGLAVVG